MRSTTLALVGLLILCHPAAPHGGQYKGPGDAGPGSSRPGGVGAPPTSPGGVSPAGPGAPTSGGQPPVTGGPSGRGTPRDGTPTSGGYDLADASGRWETWWEHNKDRYLDLKRRLGREVVYGSSQHLTGQGRPGELRWSRRPDAQRIDGEVVPLLQRLLREEDQRDVLDSAVLALGRVARAEQADAAVAAALPLLAHRDLAVQSAAALALGLSGSPRAAGPLGELMAGTAHGRQLTGGSDVPELVRAFAALALGLLDDPAAAPRLLDLLERTPDSERNLKACALAALGLLQGPGLDAAAARLVAALGDRRLDAALRSHVPTTLAKLGGGRTEALPALLATFRDRDADRLVRQSCAIALGRLARLGEDGEAVQALADAIEGERDAPTRHFAFMALADIGRRDADGVQAHAGAHDALRRLLARELRKPTQRDHRPWAALAAAVYGRAVPAAGLELAGLVEDAYARESDGSVRAACALALGLLDHRPAAGRLLADFTESRDEELRGYLAVALGFLDHDAAGEPLLAECRKTAISPTYRLQVATALGLLAEREAVAVLVETLQTAQTLAVSSAAARALGLIGDESALEPLERLAADRAANPIARTFVIVALGLVCEEGDLPWNARLSEDHNYGARVPALDEVLDIL